MKAKLATVLVATVCGIVCGYSNAQMQPARDWALYKTVAIDGSFFFAPIFTVGNVPVVMGVNQKQSVPIFYWYVDRNSYDRAGSTIRMDMVLQPAGATNTSQLRRDVVLDCSTRTFLVPTIEVYKGPLGTGELKKTRTFMKEPKVSGDLKPEDLAYFCEGPTPAPIGAAKVPASAQAAPTSSEAPESLDAGPEQSDEPGSSGN